MPSYRVSLGFARLPDQELDDFAQSVIDGMTGNGAFPTPPVTMAALGAAKTDFQNKIAKAKAGGPADTAAKNSSRQDLIGLLRQLANYVQGAFGSKLDTLLTAGFGNASTERVSKVLDKPDPPVLTNTAAGQLSAKVPPVANTSLYEGRATPDGTTTPLPSVFTGDSQHIYFNGLEPGKLYKIEIRALGGAAPGYSDWSDPTSHRAM